MFGVSVPNALSILRILLIPVFVIVFYLPFHGSHVASAVIFLLASATDWLDGYLARAWGQSSAFGAFVDPVADKLIVATALVLVVGEIHTAWIALPAAVIIGREIMISALREWMADTQMRAKVSVSYLAKVKTTVQMISLSLLLIFKPGHSVFLWLGVLGLYAAAGLTLWSMSVYLRIAWQDLTADLRAEK